MAKKTEDQQSEAQNQSTTEVHVEARSEQTITPGTVSNDQVAELTADLQRLQAEFINYKRRADAERADLANFATARVVREFLAVRDSFDQEQAHRPAKFDAAWAASIDAIRAQFDKALSNLGVERFESVGQSFDPHRHEAVASDGAGDTVTKELQAGYKLGDTILRPAMVEVGGSSEPAA
ncbi:MAG TPA: nucleotide exchange factor GrpE [Candidatus Saccharimonadia bacterium]|nr:nucleotide exchange factor GrpE [Candidatus Saccharimonadia bacterium]